MVVLFLPMSGLSSLVLIQRYSSAIEMKAVYLVHQISLDYTSCSGQSPYLEMSSVFEESVCKRLWPMKNKNKEKCAFFYNSITTLCIKCGQRFKRKNHLKEHKEEVHSY
jgi:hypothetical protein